MALSGVVLTALAMAGCSKETPMAKAPEKPTRPPNNRILEVNEGAPCDPRVTSYVPHNFRLEFEAHGLAGDRFDYELTMMDGTVTSGGGLTFSGKSNAIISSGETTFDVEKVTVHAQGTSGIPGTCTMTFPSSSSN